jgi:aspartate racemase
MKKYEYTSKKDKKVKIIGVVGGVGPEASNKFCEFLIKYKKAERDQNHLTFIHYCNPKIPDRTEYILGIGEDPSPEIIKTCNDLKKAGADILIIPCNTAHYFLKDVQKSVDLPIIDMTKVLVKKVLEENPPLKRIGILATTGSIKTQIYQKYFELVGVESILPSEEDQKLLVMDSIYGKNGIKAGKKVLPKRNLMKITNKLIEKGAEAIVLGCTEIPLVLKQNEFDVKLFDPMEIVAKEIINNVEKENEMITIKYSLNRSRILHLSENLSK